MTNATKQAECLNTGLLSHQCPWYCRAMRIDVKTHMPCRQKAIESKNLKLRDHPAQYLRTLPQTINQNWKNGLQDRASSEKIEVEI